MDKKGKSTTKTVVFATITAFILTTAAAVDQGSTGTEEDPYEIATCEQLEQISDDTSGYYVLTDDVDCSDTTNWNGGDGWNPIGTFTGTLDGQGYAIQGLYIDRGTSNYIGLFDFVQDSEIKNLRFESATILSNTGSADYIGFIAGQADNHNKITNISIENSYIEGDTYVGGIFGRWDDSTFRNNEFNKVQDTTIQNTDVHGNYYVGGITGYDSTRSVSYEDINIVSSYLEIDRYAGGITGRANDRSSDDSVNFNGIRIIDTEMYDRYSDYTGSSTYLGGVMGYASYSSYDEHLGFSDIIVKDTEIHSASNGGNFGGVSGYTRASDNKISIGYHNILIDNLDIEAGSSYVGGINGHHPRGNDGAASHFTDITVRDSDIYSGNNYAGGLSGKQDMYSYDYYLSHDVNDILIDNTDITATSGYAGGLYGRSYWYNRGSMFQISHVEVRGSSISTQGSRYSGGLIGYIRSADSTYSGDSHVSDAIVVDTEIDGGSSYTGGMFGRWRNYGMGSVWSVYSDVESGDGSTSYGRFFGTSSGCPSRFSSSYGVTWPSDNSDMSSFGSNCGTDSVSERYGEQISRYVDLDWSYFTPTTHPEDDHPTSRRGAIFDIENIGPADGTEEYEVNPSTLTARPIHATGRNVRLSWRRIKTDEAFGTTGFEGEEIASATVSDNELAEVEADLPSGEEIEYYVKAESGSSTYRSEIRTLETAGLYEPQNPTPQDGATVSDEEDFEIDVDHDAPDTELDVTLTIDDEDSYLQPEVVPGEDGTTVTFEDIPLERDESLEACVTVEDLADGEETKCWDINAGLIPPEDPQNPSPVDGDSSYFETEEGTPAQLEFDVVHQQQVENVDVELYGREEGESWGEPLETWEEVELEDTGDNFQESFEYEWERNGEDGMEGFNRGQTYQWYVRIEDPLETNSNLGNPFEFDTTNPPAIIERSPHEGEESVFLEADINNPLPQTTTVEFHILGEGKVGEDTVEGGGRAELSLAAEADIDPGDYYTYFMIIDDGVSRTSYDSDSTEFFYPDVVETISQRTPEERLALQRPEEPSDGDMWIEYDTIHYHLSGNDIRLVGVTETDRRVEYPPGTFWIEGNDLKYVGADGVEYSYTESFQFSEDTNYAAPGDMWFSEGGSAFHPEEITGNLNFIGEDGGHYEAATAAEHDDHNVEQSRLMEIEENEIIPSEMDVTVGKNVHFVAMNHDDVFHTVSLQGEDEGTGDISAGGSGTFEHTFTEEGEEILELEGEEEFVTVNVHEEE